jgi:polyisoprenoid-binding protein YceI
LGPNTEARGMKKRNWLSVAAGAAVAAGLLTLSVAGRAALSTVSGSHVTFDAAGPAGMKIEGTTTDLGATDDGTNLVVTVPLANLTTGIGLRDHHMREKYLEVQKFPVATLTIPRSALKLPSGGDSSGDAPGTLSLHGQTKPVTVHYTAKGGGSAYDAQGTFHLNMNDFAITVPVYLGVTVKPDVDVSASFHIAGT